MGVAEVIPGISGSTAALLADIYDEFIRAFKSINKQAGKLLLEKKFRAFWKHINGDFQATVAGGMLTAFCWLLVQFFMRSNIIRSQWEPFSLA